MRIAVIGAGGAGMAFAERLLQLAVDADVTVHDHDPHQPYERPKLSKELLGGGLSSAAVLAARDERLERSGVRLERGRVQGLDAATRTVLVDGASTSFDLVILAPGCAPVPTPWDSSPHVFQVHSFAQATALLPRLAPGAEVVVVGAGLVGLETAASLRAREHDVMLLSGSSEPLSRLVGDDVGALLRRMHEARGVDVVPARLSAVDPRSGSALLSDGRTIDGRVVILCTGVAPSTEWLVDSGIALDPSGAIVVDHLLTTSVAGVWACGDAAAWPTSRSEDLVRVEHWATALAQGRYLADRVASGGEAPFDDLPYFWSRQYGMTMQGAGRLAGSSVEISQERDGADPAFTAWYRQGDELTGVLSLAQPRAFLAARTELMAQH